MTAPGQHDSVDDVARAIDDLGRPLLLVFDCDGVLAPLTDHADDSELTAGVGNDLVRLTEADDVTVAILSGRSLEGLVQFGFGDGIVVAGSYGGERRGDPVVDLSASETRLLDSLDAIAVEASETAGPGAWVERKPTSVVIHVREADRERADAALATAWEQQGALAGHECHAGSNVLEFMARPTDKGRGLTALRAEFRPSATVYIGDDVPDEDAFAVLGDGDLSVKVGDGATIAEHRLAGPAEAAQLVRDLATRFGTNSEQR